MYTFPEPQFLSDLLQSANSWMHASQAWSHAMPYLADSWVFLYPVLLVVMYLIGIKNKTVSHKIGALYLFACAVGIFVLNNIIKLFFQRPRPYKLLDLPTPEEELMLQNIPTDSFPSDHAAMSMTIAVWLWIRSQHLNNKTYRTLGTIFFIIALIMGFGRVTIAIHRPTDILVWWIVGWIVAGLIYGTLHYWKKIFAFLIWIEERIIKAIWF